MLWRICVVQIQPRKHVLDLADYTASTRQHELDHTDHTDQEPIRPERSRSSCGDRWIYPMCRTLTFTSSTYYISCLTKPCFDGGFLVLLFISGSRWFPGNRHRHNLCSLFAERCYSVGRRWQWQPEGVGYGGERVGRSRICWQRGRFQDAARFYPVLSDTYQVTYTW